MATSRTQKRECAICGKEFTARWQFAPHNRFALTCSPPCSRRLGERTKQIANATLHSISIDDNGLGTIKVVD